MLLWRILHFYTNAFFETEAEHTFFCVFIQYVGDHSLEKEQHLKRQGRVQMKSVFAKELVLSSCTQRGVYGIPI